MGNCQNNEILEATHAPVLGRLGPVLELKITNCVWQKDYLGLYDYDSKDILRSVYTVKSNGLLLADKDRKIIKEVAASNYSEEILKTAAFEVIRKPNYYKILPIFIDNEHYTLQKLLWLIVKTVPHRRYPIKEKDIIKFGKQKIKVREIVLNDPNPSEIVNVSAVQASKKVYDNLKLNEEHDQAISAEKEELVEQIKSVLTENEQTCRICLEPGEFTNPLICPCKCTGSVRYLHLECLRTWLGKRLNVVKTKFCFTIKWTPLACEMCKTHYKYRIYLDNKKYYTVEIPKPGKPYIVLQVMKRSAEYSKIFHFVSLAETSKVSIGRKKQIDIKISDDVSVSRHHANFIYDFQNRTFLLEDNQSKFGTLVLVKKNLLINPFQRGIAFQMGGEIYAMETQRGEGSIPEYYDEEEYLNVNERDNKSSMDEEESEDENNEEFQDEQEEEDNNIPTSVNLPNLSPSASLNENPSSIANSLILRPTAVTVPQNLNPLIPNSSLNRVMEVEEILDA